MNYSIYLLGSLVPSRGHMMNRGCLRKGHVRKTGGGGQPLSGLSANLHLVGGVYQATTQTIAHPNHADPRIIAGVFHGPTAY